MVKNKQTKNNLPTVPPPREKKKFSQYLTVELNILIIKRKHTLKNLELKEQNFYNSLSNS